MSETKSEPTSPADTIAPVQPAGNGPHRGDRAGLWRAIAGMVFVLAIAGAIVTIEISRDMIRHNLANSHRIALLGRRLQEFKRRLAKTKTELATAREQLAARDRIESVLTASDLKALKLAAPPGEHASGALLVSRSADGAVLSAKALDPPDANRIYAAWWVVKGEPPIKAAEFKSAADASATVHLGLASAYPQGAACIVTLEPSPGATRPSGPVKLKGELRRPQ